VLATEDDDAFDCETCPVANAQATLDETNREAWSVYRRVCQRFPYDFHAAPLLLDRLTEHWPASEVVDLLDRLALMYDVLNPPRRADE
jgi:hypothetical protein